jgi:hypothetical protein
MFIYFLQVGTILKTVRSTEMVKNLIFVSPMSDGTYGGTDLQNSLYKLVKIIIIAKVSFTRI